MRESNYTDKFLALKFRPCFSDSMTEMEASEVIDLNELICRAVAQAQDEVSPSSIQLDLKLSPKAPRVMGHTAGLSQAILSLLTDAIEAASVCDRSSGRIQVTSAVIRDRVLASVIDDVPGRGTGIRFHLARNLVRDIGGDLW